MADIETISSYNLSYENKIVVAEPHGFDEAAYSRMKHGDRASTQSFAFNLADQIASDVPEFVSGEPAPDFLVAYKTVPPACFYLSKYCLDKLNLVRVENGLEPGRVVQVFKDRVTATNYATTSPAERSKELSSIGFTLNGYSIEGRPVAVLDDVRITGAAEARIVEAIEKGSPSLLALGYIAVFDADQAKQNPSVENDLNTASVTNITDIIPFIEHDNFDLNIRTLKLILGSSSDGFRENFLQSIPTSLLYNIYSGAISSGPDFVEAYRPSINQVKRVLSEHETGRP